MDPLAPEYPWYTPYQFAGNKVIEAIDLEGLEEYKVTQRSFAPWERFGSIFGVFPNSFVGDRRGFSLLPSTSKTPGIPYSTASARVHQVGNIDLGKDGFVDGELGSYQYSSVTRGKANFLSPKDTETYGLDRGKETFKDDNLRLKMQASDPLIGIGSNSDADKWFKSLQTPDIEWNLNVKIKNMGEHISIEGTLTGKSFPAYENFIEDKRGQKVFLTAVSAPKKDDLAQELLNPFHDYREEILMQIDIGEDGNFTGTLRTGQNVITGGYWVSNVFIPTKTEVRWSGDKKIEDWNLIHLQKKPAPDCNGDCGGK